MPVQPRIRAVVHVHSRLLWERLLDEGCTRTPPDVEYGTPAMATAVRKAVLTLPNPPCGVIVMAGHPEGVLAFGTSLESTIESVLTLCL